MFYEYDYPEEQPFQKDFPGAQSAGLTSFPSRTTKKAGFSDKEKTGPFLITYQENVLSNIPGPCSRHQRRIGGNKRVQE